MFDYFYGQSGEMFSYFRVPKILFRDIKFKDLSTDAKTLYGILLDRMGLSVKNGWLDEQGRVYIIFPVQEVMDALGCADNKATKLFRELEKFGLIERKRRGLGKPNLIYVKNFADPRFRNREKNGSGAADSAQQETAKSRGNKTEWNNTEMSETYPLFVLSDEYFRCTSFNLRSIKKSTYNICSRNRKYAGITKAPIFFTLRQYFRRRLRTHDNRNDFCNTSI